VQLREEIRRIQTELGITTLFVTHDQDEALAIADRVAVMRAGNVAQVATPEELYTRPSSPFVASFVGLSNHVSGVVRNGLAVVQGTTLPSSTVRTQTATCASSCARRTSSCRRRDPSVVISSSFLGSLRRTSLRLDDGTVLFVQHSVRLHPTAGERIHARLTALPSRSRWPMRSARDADPSALPDAGPAAPTSGARAGGLEDSQWHRGSADRRIVKV